MLSESKRNTSKLKSKLKEREKEKGGREIYLSAESWTTSAAEKRGSDSHWCKLDAIFS